VFINGIASARPPARLPGGADPASPHFRDFTAEYSAQRWHRFPFRAADVEAQKVEQYP